MTTPTSSSSLTVARNRRVSPLVIVAAVVALVFIGVAALVASEFAPPGRDTQVVTAFVLSTLAPTVVGLLALVRGDHAVQQGETNAQRLVDTAATVEQVAKDVNGHLTRHDTLAASMTRTAETLATLATNATPVARAATERTRATDPGQPAGQTAAAPADAPPLAPDQG